ncbi:MAG: hypothetical protein IT288_10800 [Bdellovibrionales bacterium]|nr:hypothetical protein [Bdellovibrionales bacterium]
MLRTFSFLAATFLTIMTAAGAWACGPLEQAWTWVGVNQYRPEQCSCEELVTALNEEEVLYLGTYWQGVYLFSRADRCELGLTKSGKVIDKTGQACELGFLCHSAPRSARAVGSQH